MKSYTFLLLRPDYVAESFGADTYLAHVKAIDVHEAKKVAQKEVSAADSVGNDGLYEFDYDDYHVLAVFEGHLKDLSTL